MKIKLKDIKGADNSSNVLTVDYVITSGGEKTYVCKELYKPYKNIPYIILERFVEKVIGEAENDNN